MLKNIIAAAAMVSVFASYAHAQTLGNQKTESNSLYNTSYDFEQKEYNKCVENIAGNTPREYINCLNPEIKRQTAAMNNFYTQILKLEEFKKWNNGNGMIRGNLKDMNDQFVAYRERVCSMYGMAYKDLLGDAEFGRKKCTMEINDQMLRRLQDIYGTSISDFSSFDDFEPGTI